MHTLKRYATSMALSVVTTGEQVLGRGAQRHESPSPLKSGSIKVCGNAWIAKSHEWRSDQTFLSNGASPSALSLSQLNMAGSRTFQRMNTSGREAAVPGSTVEVEVTGDLTKPSGNLPLLWGRLATSPHHGGAKTAGSNIFSDGRRAMSVPAVAWDGPGRPPGPSPSGAYGSGGVGPSAEALSRQGTVSPISPPSFTQIIRVRPRQEGAAALHRSQVSGLAHTNMHSMFDSLY